MKAEAENVVRASLRWDRQPPTSVTYEATAGAGAVSRAIRVQPWTTPRSPRKTSPAMSWPQGSWTAWSQSHTASQRTIHARHSRPRSGTAKFRQPRRRWSTSPASTGGSTRSYTGAGLQLRQTDDVRVRRAGASRILVESRCADTRTAAAPVQPARAREALTLASKLDITEAVPRAQVQYDLATSLYPAPSRSVRRRRPADPRHAGLKRDNLKLRRPVVGDDVQSSTSRTSPVTTSRLDRSHRQHPVRRPQPTGLGQRPQHRRRAASNGALIWR